MVPEAGAVSPHDGGAEYRLPAEAAGAGGGRDRAQVREMADLMHLSRNISRFPRQLSDDEQQRVALARSMISAPGCCCSTSRSALDVKLKKILQAELKRLHRSPVSPSCM
jgi:ABC-type Fe3+/spermidine/putrescine transport system ATPase subunit